MAVGKGIVFKFGGSHVGRGFEWVLWSLRGFTGTQEGSGEAE